MWDFLMKVCFLLFLHFFFVCSKKSRKKVCVLWDLLLVVPSEEMWQLARLPSSHWKPKLRINILKTQSVFLFEMVGVKTFQLGQVLSLKCSNGTNISGERRFVVPQEQTRGPGRRRWTGPVVTSVLTTFIFQKVWKYHICGDLRI